MELPIEPTYNQEGELVGTSLPKGLVVEYADFVKRNPNSLVLVDPGGKKNGAIDPNTIKASWKKQFEDSGISAADLVIAAAGEVPRPPTISLITTRPE